jgi:hypothetical protein
MEHARGVESILAGKTLRRSISESAARLNTEGYSTARIAM